MPSGTQALAIFMLCQPQRVGLSSWAASFVVQGADLETRICMQVVFFGGDPKKPV